MSTVPEKPKIYHIVHVDKLDPILTAGSLLCDSQIANKESAGTTIGMDKIKRRRMTELQLKSCPDLYVGDCVPFYFCPRSVMLYMFHMGNHPEISYKGGQGPIVHLEADLYKTVKWAQENNRCWAFTLSNAGSKYFEDRSDLEQLSEINWDAVNARSWSSCREYKQAEFLIQHSFPWHLIEKIGVSSTDIFDKVENAIQNSEHKPSVEVMGNWYY